MKKVLATFISLLAICTSVFAQSQPEIFLKALESEFKFKAIDHDDEGNTYIIGSDQSKTSVRKFDAAGIQVRQSSITLANPVALTVTNDGFLYIANNDTVFRLNSDSLERNGTDNFTIDVASADLEFHEIREMEFLAIPGYAKGKLVLAAQRQGTDSPYFVVTDGDLSQSLANSEQVEVTEAGVATGGGVTVRGMTVDDNNSVYITGETGSDAAAGYTKNTGYIAKLTVSVDGGNFSYTKKVGALDFFNDSFEIEYSAGWLNVLGVVSISPYDDIVIARLDTTLDAGDNNRQISLNEIDSYVSFENGTYSSLINDNNTNKKRFSLTSDDLNNLYVTAYTDVGTTLFRHNGSDEYRTIASTGQTAFVAKIKDDYTFDWLITPIVGSTPEFRNRMAISWDANNSRIWWSGSFAGTTLNMQEGSDASSLKSLGDDPVTQGFVAVLEASGAFTEIVDFTLLTDFGEDRVTLNGGTFGSKGATFEVILNSDITIQTPREIYRWNQSSSSVLETDSVEANQNIIDNADTQFSFLNFSVNSVVEASSATSYSFTLTESTIVQLEWLVNYALFIDSNFANTASRSVNNDGSLYVDPLNSDAAGSPDPAVGKHWIEKDTQLILQIDGFEENASAGNALNVRYVPFSFNAGGAYAEQVAVTGEFPTVEPVQQMDEFTMSGPASITYNWKLQYGVDIRTTDPSIDAEVLVDYIQDFDGSTDTQSDAEGAGVYWYDDGTTVRIATPFVADLADGPKAVEGWISGDNYIFSPGQGDFGDSVADLLSTEQIDDGFTIAPYVTPGKSYVGITAVLDRPARVIWSYGDQKILKTINVGEFVEFTRDEIEAYGLLVGTEPTLDVPDIDPTSGAGDIATSEDYIWDPIAKKFFPVRSVVMDLQWATETEVSAKVEVTVLWDDPDYLHIADTPAVSLIAHPPEGEPEDFIYQSLAYSAASAAVSDANEFTASQPGYSVLVFNRLTPSGRGGVAQSVVEVKVVETSRWNANLGSTRGVFVGQKITSLLDLAGLETGYTFFDKAAYNPYIYDAERFIGEALWDVENPPGPVIPVNTLPAASPATNDELVIVWYDDPSLNDYLLWPHAAERYRPQWPALGDGLARILMSSGFGSESLGPIATDQEIVGQETVDGVVYPATTTFDPARVEQVSIYNQPDSSSAGYNPNEEHALLAPSLRYADVAPRPLAAYALRENDLNVISSDGYTSHPYVLVQYYDKAVEEFKMKVFYVRRNSAFYPNGFQADMVAGEPVIPFYPIGVVSGATLCESTYAEELNPNQLTYWRDHKGTAWAVSGGGSFKQYFYYPVLPDFVWPDGSKVVGEHVAWLPNSTAAKLPEEFDINYDLPDEQPDAQGVLYTTSWPLDVSTMKVGETLTFAGGEYAADNPGKPGLPGVLAWAAGEVIYDDLNPDMREGSTDRDGKNFENYTARILPALEQRTVDLLIAQFPEQLLPATGRTNVDGSIYKFAELSSSLKKRIFYDPISGKLGLKGYINDKDIGAPTLTAAPPAVYVLEPNILTFAEYQELKGTDPDSPFVDISGNGNWTAAVDALYELSRNPNGLSQTRKDSGNGYTAGLQVRIPAEGALNANEASSYKALGPGLALVANPAFLDPAFNNDPDLQVSYVTLAENNDPSLGGSPVTLHIIKIDRRERYRGAIKVVLSDNVFDENIILRHTGDFGANANSLVFDWWYRVEDGTEALPPDQIAAGTTNPWKLFPDPDGDGGEDFYQLKLKGNPQAPELLLADSLWFVRYRHVDEAPTNPVTWVANPEIPFEWAGAGNSSPLDLDGDGIANYQAQLAQGWVKRVLDAVNPYEARIRDFNGDAPATYASMIRQFGQRYEGPVALNPAKNVIENVGLIELYATVLNRARNLSIDLSTPVSTPGITNALQLASTRLADFYMLLGNEAYSDAQDPMISFGSDSVEYGDLATTVFTFQNQLGSKMEEELGLLRGVWDFKARPVYNRLFWNFTKGEGEAAYATSYNISDVTLDGFIDEDDAMILYPQGHGDAWGHYLTAIRGQYELLNNDYFNWVSRSELYSLQDIVFDVDFLDERKFAQVAATKAKAGSEIMSLTYREAYVEDPDSQWQGYLDSNTNRAWGVEGWARRTGQGAYFDWVTANALIPSEHPNSGYTGIRKVDRTTVKDIAVISANMNAVQQTFEQANDGFNPLGIAGNTVSFDIDPSQLAGGKSHFEQIYDRAFGAVTNAFYIFDEANKAENLIRKIENNEVDFRRSVFEEDLAYRNQLIEIFGSPYEGTIGAGKAYPAGYLGPDTQLYMYVDRQSREISEITVPGVANSFVIDLIANVGPTLVSNFPSFEFLGVDYGSARTDYAPSFSADNPSDWFGAFGGVNYTVTEDDGITFDTANARVGLTNVALPIKASGYTFQAPDGFTINSDGNKVAGGEDWGLRQSPGQLQLHISKMIQQEANLAKSIAAWDGFQGELVRTMRLINTQVTRDDDIRGLLAGKIASNTVLGAAIIAQQVAANLMFEVGESVQDIAIAAPEFIPKNLPTGGLAVSPGDAAAPARGAINLAGSITSSGMSIGAVVLAATTSATELLKDLISEGLDYDIDKKERDFDLLSALVDLENQVGDEGILRVEIFRQQEELRRLSDEYRALLQKGARLIDEREAYNKRVAELTQRNRYQDMTFRVARNSALQRYHEAFDLAARYVYLTAKAYDYETNLEPGSSGSAQGVLSDIIGERSIGQIVRGTSFSGRGGLSDHLVRLKDNYDVLKGQLGLNNPQTETGRFSLRGELFRILPDASSDIAWEDELAMARVDNLWDLPEFRRYCRPFAAFDPNVAEPGIVIDFTSYITSRKNFFGRDLAGGDNAYDPTNFATKIYSVGAWFEGYLSSDFGAGSTELSETPRIYLVPVGSDVMSYPSDENLEVRMWDVLDQKIPVPYPVSEANFDDSTWRPLDTLGGTEASIRKFSSFRAYHDSGYFNENEMTFDTRLVGRSVWNTRWLLIIPGSTLNADPDVGLNTFIKNVSDIKLFFQTYGYSGN